MRRLAPLAILIGVVVVQAAPISATHDGIHPTFRSETVYFHCAGPTKLENLNNALAPAPAPWNTTAPTQSIQQGAGCGAVDPGLVRSTGTTDAYFAGSFTGNLRDMTLRLHNLLLGRARQTPVFQLKINVLRIDGVLWVDNRTLSVTAVPSSTGASEYVEMSITGIGSATDVLDENGEVIDVITTGLATDDGDGTTARTLELMIDTDPSDQNSAWVWDTTEVPAGIVFNPTSLATAKLAVIPPE